MVRRAWPGDARQLAPWLRAADKREIRLASGKTPLRSLLDGVESSENCFALKVDGVCEAVFGVVRQTDDFGIIWLLGSPWLPKHPRVVLEGARLFLPVLCCGYAQVGNMIHDKQTTYIRFLRHLGFEFSSHPEFKPEFLLFTGSFSYV